LIEPKAKLGDYVWIDKNENGIQDDGEPGLGNVRVNLLSGGSVIASVYTTMGDAVYGTGYYEFDKLWAGDYIVEFVPDEKYRFTKKGAGSPADSDVNAATGRTDTITLAQGEANRNIDAGVLEPKAKLGDYVWYDDNEDGVQDEWESGANGITVTLYDHNGQVKSSTVTSTVYGKAGYYEFTDLPAGQYLVEFQAEPGFKFTLKNQEGDVALDSDANPGGRTDLITLNQGEANMTIDAGLIREVPNYGEIGDYVWFDANGDGIQNDGNTGINGITVSLYDGKGKLKRTTVTQSVYVSVYGYVYGRYLFEDVPPGVYVVKFDKPSDHDYVFTVRNAGDTGTDSDAGPDGQTAAFTLGEGVSKLDIDAGFVPRPHVPGSIGDTVWVDTYGDGIQNETDTGLNGVTVELYDGGGTYLASTVTSSVYGKAGSYLFPNLLDGSYKVRFILPEGYTFTASNEGDNDAADSDADPDGWTETVILSEDEDNLTIDAGLKRLAGTIGDYVWIDANGDGIQNSDEAGINNVKVTLFNGAGVPIASTETGTIGGKQGYYRFDNLDAGDYQVQFDLPNGYRFTVAHAGNEEADSDAGENGLTGIVHLGWGETNLSVDAGLKSSFQSGGGNGGSGGNGGNGNVPENPNNPNQPNVPNQPHHPNEPGNSSAKPGADPQNTVRPTGPNEQGQSDGEGAANGHTGSDTDGNQPDSPGLPDPEGLQSNPNDNASDSDSRSKNPNGAANGAAGKGMLPQTGEPLPVAPFFGIALCAAAVVLWFRKKSD